MTEEQVNENQNDSSSNADDEDDEKEVPNLYKTKELTKISEETTVLKAKRKYHPNENKYVGYDTTQETMVKEIEYMNLWSDEQSKMFGKNKLIFDQVKFDAYWNEILVDDIIGFKGNVYRVTGKSKTNLSLNKRNVKRYRNDEDSYSEQTIKVSRYDLDYMLNIDFTEILYRNGKPYGVSEELEYKVNVAVYQDEDGKIHTSQKGHEVKQKKESQENPALPPELI